LFNTTYATTFTTTYNTTYITTFNTTAAVTAFTSTAASNFNGACNEFMSNTYYGSNVSSGLPQNGSFVYTNSAGTSALAAAWYGAQNNTGFSPTHKYKIISGGEVVGAPTQCTGGGGLPSDRKLKKHIKLIGKSNKGINIYSFEFKKGIYADKFAGVWQGVMADEVEHIDGAVINHRNSKWVDYSMLDVEFKTIKS